MDITILQTPQALIAIAIATFVTTLVYGWKYYQKYIHTQQQRLSVLHIKKLAGNASQEELDRLTKKGFVPNFSSKKRKKKFSWSEFKESVKQYDFKERIKKYNPFLLVRQMEEMQKKYSDLQKDTNRYRNRMWSVEDDLKSLKESINPPKPKKVDPPKPKEVATSLKIGADHCSSFE